MESSARGTGVHGLQRLLWLGQKLSPESPGANLAFTFDIRGAIDPDRFDDAIRMLVERSDAFRTVIEERDGIPFQRALPRIDEPLERVDLSREEDPEAALRGWVAERAAVPFRMDARLFATALIRMAPDRWIWFLNQHHAVADGWSYARTFRYVAEAYRLAREGRPETAPVLPAFHGRAAPGAPEGDSDPGRGDPRRGPAAGAPAGEPLRFYGEVHRGTRRERRVTRPLGPRRTAALREVAARDEFRGLTDPLSMLCVLTVALLAYLRNVTGTVRPAVAVPFHQRTGDADRDLIGLVQEMVPIETELDPDETFASLARKVNRRIWRALRGARAESGARGRGPEVLLNFPNVSFGAFDGLPVRTTWIHPGSGDGARSLFVQVVDFDGSGELTVHFDGSEDVFDAATHERAADHFVRTIDRLLEDPGRRVAGLDLLGDAERRHLLVDLNRTREDYPAGNLRELFEEAARRTPEREALVLGDETLTYRELGRRANRLARALRERGAAPGARVAACVERSVEAMVGLLAVLESGAAWVPMDPAYPRERLAFLLEDADPCLLLTQERLRPALPATDLPVLALDGDAQPWERLPDDPLPGGARPTDPGYVIYTSGSTGRPKGVVMSQGALVNLIRWQVRQPTELDRPRTLQFTPLTFDVSLQETLSTWVAGGTLVLVPEATRRDPEATLRLLEETRVERLFIIFTPFQKIAEAADRAGRTPPSLREVITAGEQLRVTPSVRRFFERSAGRCALHNQYGPSETHIVTAFELPRDPAEWAALPSIGKPIASTTAYVLDAARRPVPLGVPGELWIGGAQVAEGYLNRPDLTAERFVPDPFRTDGSRMYRTGDLARFLRDGNLEFLGRVDHQIKLRGYRIELGEIEAVLAQHPTVREAVVTVRESAGEKRLVGYVVPEREAAAGPGRAGGPDGTKAEAARLAAEMRRFLLERLPEPMVPSAFVPLDRIPQTPNGKVDRLSLPEPDGLRPDLDADFVAPGTGTERTVAEAWRAALGIDRVGLRDNFFDLGGHSLLLVEVHDALRGKLPREVTVVDLFRYPTVEQLARFAEEGGDELRGIEERAARQREAVGRAAGRRGGATRPGPADA